MGRFNLNQILSDTSKAAAGGGSAKPRPSESRYEKLSVFDLVPSEDNFYSMREIGELKAAIEIAGKVLQNLVVVPLGDGKYKVIAGHRRRLASIELVNDGKPEYEFVPCVIEPTEEAADEQEIRDGLDLIAVVLGALSSSERFTAATTLLDYGFAAYAAVPLPAMEDRPLLIKVKGSAEESVPLDYTALPETLLMPKENAAALTAQLDLPQELEAPVQLGQTVGTVRILSGETQLGEYEVHAAADAEKMDFGTAFGLLWNALTGCEN